VRAHVEFLNAFNRVVYANPNTDPKLRFREGDEPEQSAARHPARGEVDFLESVAKLNRGLT